jgi:hypothetical protein
MGRSTQLSRSMLVTLGLLLCGMIIAHAAVIGIDFGSEFIKVLT